MKRRLPGASPAAPAFPLEDDDLLREILVRLPAQPSSLPRASAVCTRWRGLVTDPQFLRLFRVHHRKPPLLGFIEWSYHRKPPLLGFIERRYPKIYFNPILDPPDRIPPERLDLGPCSHDTDVLDCRHGLLLLRDPASKELVVCDPITGEQRHVAIPSEFNRHYLNGVVLCSAGEQGHVHGSCHSSPFKVVMLMRISRQDITACVYSSETDVWGNLISRAAPTELYGAFARATLIGNALYWLSFDRIVEFDLDENNLAVLQGPPRRPRDFTNGQLIKAEGGVVGLAILSFLGLRMWYRNVNCHGVATWVLWKTIEMQHIYGLDRTDLNGIILGYSEDTDELCLYVEGNVYMVQLKSMQSKILLGIHRVFKFHPFTSFYTPGTTIHGCDEADMLHNP